MSKNFFWVLLISLVLTGCQTASNLQNGNSKTDLEADADATPADVNKIGFIDTVPPVSPDDNDSSSDQTANTPKHKPSKPQPPKNLWTRIRNGFELNLNVNKPRLSSQLRWFSSHPGYLNRVSKRGERYLYYIVTQLQKAHIPTEIALLPIVESGFDPFGYSHGQASGPWQFIPSTGRMYGLDQDWWYDGRRDIIDSTHAAIAYLTRLEKMFNGNWLLALAAYNSGEGTVLNAIHKNRREGKPTDFWALDLPKETRAYVPKLLALAKIIKDPAKYHYKPVFIPNKPYFESVNIGGQLDLAQAAKMADISIDEVYLLNPAFNQWATAPDGPHRLLIPVKKAALFRANLAKIPQKDRVTWVRYRVEAGDNLRAIAKSHNTTVNVIEDVNKMSSTLIRVGQELMIPVAGNKISSYTLSSHQRLLAKQDRAPGRNRIKINYTVQPGDSLWAISNKYDTNSTTLARWNNMGLADPLRPGKKLVIWLEPKRQANSSNRSIIKKVVYTIRSGDSLAMVANKFRVTLNEIRKWNPEVGKQKYVQPGDKVTLLVNVVGG